MKEGVGLVSIIQANIMKWKIDRDKSNTYFSYGDSVLKFHKDNMLSESKVSQQTPIFFPDYRLSYLPSLDYKIVLKEGVSSSIGQIIRNRRSSWEFRNNEMEVDDFYNFLYESIGTSGERSVTFLNDKKEIMEENVLVRSYPSGGALYPIKIYLYINNVRGLDQGIYEYRHGKSDTLHLLKLDNNDTIDDFSTFKYDNKSFKTCNFIVFLASDLLLHTRYGRNQYKLSLLECGHIVQNIMLVSTYYDRASVPIGGYFEAKLNRFLGIDKINETVLYFIAVG